MKRLTDKLSCADFTFPMLPHEEALKAIKLCGIDAVDLGFFSGRSHLQPEHVRGKTKGAAKTLAKRLHNLDLKLADVFLQTSPDPAGLPANHPRRGVRQKTREMFEMAVEFAATAGCKHLTGLPGVLHRECGRAGSLELAAEEASWRASVAACANVTYSIEAHVGSICPTPEATLDFLQLAKGVTLTLDYGHFIYQGRPNQVVHPLLPYASHFHARAGCKGRLQAALKNNTIDFQTILRQLRRQKYNGFICLEYVWVDWEHCNEVDNISETILLKNHLRSLEKH